MYSVSQRGREIGIRLALGASRANIVRLVIGHGVRFVLMGLGVGTAIAFGAARLLSTMLFGLAATDVATFVKSRLRSQQCRWSPVRCQSSVSADR